MKSKSQLKFSDVARRSAYRTLEGWALGVLIEQQAVSECEHHGHRRDPARPDAWNRAREEAWRNPFPGANPRDLYHRPRRDHAFHWRFLPGLLISGLHIPAPRPIFHPLSNGGVFVHGPARQLEGLFAIVTGDVPDRIVPSDLGIREDQFQ